jgi:hypothetical protein
MTGYRLYHLHGPRNEVESFYEFEAPDEESAIAIAEQRRGVNAMELWQGHQKLRRWDGITRAPHPMASPQSRSS